VKACSNERRTPNAVSNRACLCEALKLLIVHSSILGGDMMSPDRALNNWSRTLSKIDLHMACKDILRKRFVCGNVRTHILNCYNF